MKVLRTSRNTEPIFGRRFVPPEALESLEMPFFLKRVFGVEDFGITRASIPCWGPVGSRASAKNKQEALKLEIQSTQTRNPKLLMGLTVPKPLNPKPYNFLL